MRFYKLIYYHCSRICRPGRMKFTTEGDLEGFGISRVHIFTCYLEVLCSHFNKKNSLCYCKCIFFAKHLNYELCLPLLNFFPVVHNLMLALSLCIAALLTAKYSCKQYFRND
ncbi:hypothetical protein VNO80_10673 [Phaseolus coccineus]|uniref:Uncharacterized protein n=1 Tax=Phaseolus coccineus TaxID=3886 RepID=A0AAN9RAN8_PHACN